MRHLSNIFQFDVSARMAEISNVAADDAIVQEFMTTCDLFGEILFYPLINVPKRKKATKSMIFETQNNDMADLFVADFIDLPFKRHRIRWMGSPVPLYVCTISTSFIIAWDIYQRILNQAI
jgi:hypothetical protein